MNNQVTQNQNQINKSKDNTLGLKNTDDLKNKEKNDFSNSNSVSNSNLNHTKH
jgi:hypothetical protein